MSKVPIDIYVKIKYDTTKKENSVTIEKTNIRKELIEDFLLEWLRTEMGQGKDKRKAIEREVYEIVIGCDLSYDAFHVQSDTGNDGLTCGIVMEAVRSMGE